MEKVENVKFYKPFTELRLDERVLNMVAYLDWVQLSERRLLG